MAESVDALVSNTSGETRAGSTPARGTEDNIPQNIPRTAPAEAGDMELKNRMFQKTPSTTLILTRQ